MPLEKLRLSYILASAFKCSPSKRCYNRTRQQLLRRQSRLERGELLQQATRLEKQLHNQRRVRAENKWLRGRCYAYAILCSDLAKCKKLVGSMPEQPQGGRSTLQDKFHFLDVQMKTDVATMNRFKDKAHN